MGNYILSMGCVDGSSLEVACFSKEDIVGWLRKVDHEGASWSVVHHDMNGAIVIATHDITSEIQAIYEA